MATVFTVAQQKGGAGKSTLAAHLAVAWLKQKKTVALIDIDPQHSLGRWFEARMETLGAEAAGLGFTEVTGWRTQKVVEDLGRSHDIVVIDSPPHAETEAKIAIRAADMVVVPSQPSPMDVWATVPTLEMASKEKSPAVIVLNRVPPRAALTEQMIERLGDYDVGLAKSSIGNRVAFADSMVRGLTALETKPSSIAATEMRALAKELLSKA
ncbi:ParA family partition ATPase [Hwanghaeella sp.]|uniref:ParA family partition ATPase n=1 Tax=Hwanghaeella sp. TaxID=2605943 RepID=UPI003CCB81E8